MSCSFANHFVGSVPFQINLGVALELKIAVAMVDTSSLINMAVIILKHPAGNSVEFSNSAILSPSRCGNETKMIFFVSFCILNSLSFRSARSAQK